MSDNVHLDEVQYRYIQLLVDAGCRIRHKVEYFGKLYVWLTDRDGTWFLESIPDDQPIQSFTLTPDPFDGDYSNLVFHETGK